VEVLCHVAQTRNVVLGDGSLKDNAIARSLLFDDSDNDLASQRGTQGKIVGMCKKTNKLM
jgi:hypothetical protein